MFASRIRSRRTVLRTATMAMVAACLPLAACDSLGGGGQDPSATGTWVGSFELAGAPELGSVPMTLRLVQREGGELDGEGNFTNASTNLETPLVFAGQHAFPSVSGELILGDDVMNLSGKIDSDAEVLTGQLTSGPVTANFSLTRQ